MARVFISHSSRDGEASARIKDWLLQQGFEAPFLDFDKHTGIAPGSDWEKTLYREIECSEAMIIIQTPNWLDSKWCFVEFTQARALGKPIFPVIETPTGETLIAPDIQALDLIKDREGGLDQLSNELTAIALNAQGGFGWDAHRSPYPGLLAFQEQDAAIFFGRDDAIRRVIERLNARRAQGGKKLIAILGASGSGKSSLLRAGVIPRVRRDPRNWIILPIIRPQQYPVDELARSIALALNQGADWRKWRDELSKGNLERTLSDLANDLRMQAGANEAQILIPIDQAEELYSTSDTKDANRFFEILSAALSDKLPFLAVLTQRSDYLEQLQKAEKLTARFEEFSLGPLPLSRYAQIIEGPARVAGVNIEDGLVLQAAQDAQTEDALPLLAFALRELYDRHGEDRHLSLDEYQSMGDPVEGLTPLENAVRKAADSVIEELQPSEEQLLALRDAFIPDMVQINQKGEYVRRAALWSQLPKEAHAILLPLCSARLLTVRAVGGDGKDRLLEVAHEALLRKWPRLRAWLDDAREFLVGRQQLERDLQEWETAAAEEKTGALLTGLRLNRARAWMEERAHQFNDNERRYIDASIARADARKERKQRLRRRILGGTAAAAVVLACTSVFSVWQWFETQTAFKRSQANHLAFISNQLLKEGDPTRALRVAQAAYDIAPAALSPSVDQALTNSYARVVAGGSPYYKAKLQHKDRVLDPVFSPDGKRLVTTSASGKAKLWDSEGNLLKELPHLDEKQQPQIVMRAAFSHKGDRFVTVGYGKLAKLWDKDGNLIRNMVGHGCLVRPGAGEYCTVDFVGFSPDDSTIVTASSEEKLIMWTRDGKKSRELNEHQGRNGWISSFAISPDGKYFASGGGDYDRTTQLWDKDGNHIASLEEPSSSCDSTGKPHWACGIRSIAFDPDGEFLLTSSADKTIKMYDLTGQLLKTLGDGSKKTGHTNTVVSVTFSPDGKSFLSASEDGTAILWNRDGTIKRRFKGKKGGLNSAIFSPDGHKIVTAGGDGSVRMWSLDGKQLALFQGHGSGVNALQFSPDGKTLLTASNDKTARLWPVAADHVAVLRHGNQVKTAHFLNDDKQILTSSQDMTVRLWEAGTHKELKVFSDFSADRQGNKDIFSLDVSPDGKHFITTDHVHHLRLWDLGKGTHVKPAQQPGGCSNSGWCGLTNARYSDDGEYIVGADFSGTIGLFDKTLKLIGTIPSMGKGNKEGHDGLVTGLGFSPDNKYFATGSHDKTIKLWELSTRKLVQTMTGHTGPVMSVRFSPDGKNLLSASADQTVKMWTLEGEVVRDIAAHSGLVISAVFSRDGQTILTASHDKTAKLWDRQGNLIKILRLHNSLLNDARFSKAGDRITTSSGDKTAVVWLEAGAVREWLGKQAIYRLTAKDWKELGVGEEGTGTSKASFMPTWITGK